LAELLASNENLRRVPPATEDEIMELPVIRIIQAELGESCESLLTKSMTIMVGL